MGRKKKTDYSVNMPENVTLTKPLIIRAKKENYIKWGRMIPIDFVTIENPEKVFFTSWENIQKEIIKDDNIEVGR